MLNEGDILNENHLWSINSFYHQVNLKYKDIIFEFPEDVLFDPIPCAPLWLERVQNFEEMIGYMGEYISKPLGWIETKTWIKDGEIKTRRFDYMDYNRWYSNLNLLLNDNIDTAEFYNMKITNPEVEEDLSGKKLYFNFDDFTEIDYWREGSHDILTTSNGTINVTCRGTVSPPYQGMTITLYDGDEETIIYQRLHDETQINLKEYNCSEVFGTVQTISEDKINNLICVNVQKYNSVWNGNASLEWMEE